MKAQLLVLLAICMSMTTNGQKPKVTWGDEFKLNKGSTDLEVIHSDKSGVYLQESHLAMKSYYVFGYSARTSATLVKLDKNLSEVYRNGFNKELKGKEFEQFFVLRDKVFILASNYNRKDKTLELSTAEIDKTSGDLSDEWRDLTSFQKDEKKDDIRFKISYNADSSKIIIVSSLEGREKNTYQVQEFDKNMKAGKAVTLSNEFDPKTFQLEDVLYTTNKKIILVGRMYEYLEGKKKKSKFLEFVNYNVRVYDEAGKQLNEINTSINGKWLISTKLAIAKEKDLVLAAFYSKEKRGDIDGMLIQRIDPNSGKVISTSEKEINQSMLSNLEDEDKDASADDGDDDSKAERKERAEAKKVKEEADGFSKFMQFRNIFYTPDNGLLILAEKYHSYTYESTSYTPGRSGMPGSTSSVSYTVYLCGDLLMCKADAQGNISWLQVLPKQQRESIRSGASRAPNGMSMTFNYFNAYNMPFFAGFAAMQNNNVDVIFNDHAQNSDVLRAGQKTRTTFNFAKSECNIVSIDQLTGKYTRKLLFSNEDNPTAMPRLGSVLGNEMYIIGKTEKMLKTKIAVAKIKVI